jgi:hypothetical protein
MLQMIVLFIAKREKSVHARPVYMLQYGMDLVYIQVFDRVCRGRAHGACHGGAVCAPSICRER